MRDWNRLHGAALALLLILHAGCGGGGATDAGLDGEADATADGATDTGVDGNETCMADTDCDDGLFCTGAERCLPSDDGADARGCVLVSAPRCDPLGACDEARDACLTSCDLTGDNDGDGHITIACGGDDCDDTDANRYPGNVEVCDPGSHDEDCDPATFGFVDADMDGVSIDTCCNVAPDGSFNCGADCDDANGSIHPGAGDGPPAACDGLDNDCDGTTDESCPCTEGETRDCGVSAAQIAGVGACEPGTQICAGGSFTSACVGGRGPQPEVCDGVDNDCDGDADNGVLVTYHRDEDGDGFGVDGATTGACSPPAGWAANVLDCDDTNPSVSPVGTEVCDGTTDENCNGLVDEGLRHAYYRDADGDGFGDATARMDACFRPDGYALAPTDCDDTTAGVSPAAPERCDGVDNDCSGAADEGCSCTNGTHRPCGADDGSGGIVMTGACAAGEQLCTAGLWSTCVGAISPATEVCNGVDDDCDGLVDEGVKTPFYRDADGDGFGTAASHVNACAAPAGHVRSGTDCNDGAAAVNPAATESCDGMDNDCDGAVDEGVKTPFYRDADGDGFGRAAGSVLACTPASGYVRVAADCNDTASGVHPGAVDICDGVDNDCSGTADVGCACTDGSTRACGRSDGTGGYLSMGRCVVGSQICVGGAWGGCIGAVEPTIEVCNGLDDDCNGVADDGVTADCYQDGDGDGRGTGALVRVCAASGGGCPAGFAALPGDCNDSNSAIAPGKAEVCNAIDDNCNGSVDEGGARECVQNQILPCTTACGTSGLHTCDATCRWREAVCAAPAETCNYCDDNESGSIEDERPLASGTTDIGGDCDVGGTRYGVTTCQTVPSSGNLARLSNYQAAPGAYWIDQAAAMGYGGFVAEAATVVTDAASDDPGEGWAMVIANDTGPTLGGSGTALGVPYARHGLSIEWRFNGDGVDTLQVRRLTGSAGGVLLGAAMAVNAGNARLDNGGTEVGQWLRVTLQTANGGTPERLRVEVWNSATVGYDLVIDSADPIWGFPVNSGFAPGEDLRGGLVASGGPAGRSRVDSAVYLGSPVLLLHFPWPFHIETTGQCGPG